MQIHPGRTRIGRIMNEYVRVAKLAPDSPSISFHCSHSLPMRVGSVAWIRPGVSSQITPRALPAVRPLPMIGVELPPPSRRCSGVRCASSSLPRPGEFDRRFNLIGLRARSRLRAIACLSGKGDNGRLTGTQLSLSIQAFKNVSPARRPAYAIAIRCPDCRAGVRTPPVYRAGARGEPLADSPAGSRSRVITTSPS
jgi:hypothetical protein